MAQRSSEAVTKLMEALDPEEARGIIDPALRLMIELVRHYDRYIVQSTTPRVVVAGLGISLGPRLCR
jgi:hypothetical protein